MRLIRLKYLLKTFKKQYSVGVIITEIITLNSQSLIYIKMKSYTVNSEVISGDENANSRIPQYLAAAAVTVGGFSMGNALGWSSPALPNLSETADFPLLSSDLPWIGSILTVGAALGALFSGGMVDCLGRKWSMLISSMFLLWGWISLALAKGVTLLLMGRFLTGVGVGCLSLVAPVFLTEISQSSIRGVVGVGFQLMVVLGSLFSTVLGTISGWRVLSWACALVPVIFASGILALPESPRFLLRKGKVVEAQKALNWLRGCNSAKNPSSQVLKEFEDMQESINSSQNAGSVSLKSILSPGILRPILITVGLVLFNQICGISAVNFYTVDIFKAAESAKTSTSSLVANISQENFANFGNDSINEGHATGFVLDSNLSAIIVQLVQVGAVFLSSLLVDRVGRRILLLASFAIMASSLLGLGASFYVANWGSAILTWLPLASVITYNVGYSVGIGSLVWTVMSEILPASVVGVVYAVCTAYNWALAFLITKYFSVLKESLEIHNTFWAFGVCCVVAGVVIFATVPETKGRSLEQIQEQFFKGKNNKSESKSDLVDV